MSQKLDSEEFNALTELQQKVDSIIYQYGALNIQKRMVENELVVLENNLATLEVGRVELMAKLSKKYGSVGSINLENGEIISELK